MIDVRTGAPWLNLTWWTELELRIMRCISFYEWMKMHSPKLFQYPMSVHCSVRSSEHWINGRFSKDWMQTAWPLWAFKRKITLSLYNILSFQCKMISHHVRGRAVWARPSAAQSSSPLNELRQHVCRYQTARAASSKGQCILQQLPSPFALIRWNTPGDHIPSLRSGHSCTEGEEQSL